ncbi:hypothetical protein C4564_00100 [Candidatus Microgenomates bacterium]|nr:MAG: hypothetical protein C4564_00100 [Candidatus Microgenomates bacterium]
MDIGKVALGIVTFFLGVIEALLGFRFVLKILAANSTAQFTEFVYSSSDPLVSAFQGVFPSFEVAGFTLELHTILAMVAFGVVGVVIIVLLRHFEGVKVKAPQVNTNQPNVQQAQQMPVQMPQQPMVQMPPQPQAPMSAPTQYYQQPPQQTAQTSPVPEKTPAATPDGTIPQQ